MTSFPEFIRIPLGDWIEAFLDWVIINFEPIFSSISDAILAMLLGLEKVLLSFPWWLVLLLVIIAGWRIIGSLRQGIILAALLFLVGTFGLWDLMMRTLAIVGISVLISVAIGIPLGILMSRSRLIDAIMRPILDGMQTMPSFVYLIPAVFLFHLGKVPAVFATVIYSVPPVIRLTCLGIRQVPAEMVEAALAFGSTRRQLLLKVQMPLALPNIMAGVNQTTMMGLAMVVIASMIGARGLGEEILLAITRLDISKGVEAGLAIVIMAIILDRILQSLGTKGSQKKAIEN